MSSSVSDENAFAFGTVFKLLRAFIWKFHEGWASQRLAIELNVTERKNSIESCASFNICQWLNENIPDKNVCFLIIPLSFFFHFSFIFFIVPSCFIRIRHYALRSSRLVNVHCWSKIWSYETHVHIHIFFNINSWCFHIMVSQDFGVENCYGKEYEMEENIGISSF